MSEIQLKKGGRLLNEEASNENELDFSELNSGMYFLKYGNITMKINGSLTIFVVNGYFAVYRKRRLPAKLRCIDPFATPFF